MAEAAGPAGSLGANTDLVSLVVSALLTRDAGAEVGQKGDQFLSGCSCHLFPSVILVPFPQDCCLNTEQHLLSKWRSGNSPRLVPVGPGPLGSFLLQSRVSSLWGREVPADLRAASRGTPERSGVGAIRGTSSLITEQHKGQENLEGGFCLNHGCDACTGAWLPGSPRGWLAPRLLLGHCRLGSVMLITLGGTRVLFCTVCT